ncbi:MAG: hypothetical protein UDG28_02050 [Prevotellamassilia sp.]|nr:hypothetical protein [Prevotellamassilia sp.]
MEHPLLMAFVSEMRCKGMNYLRICQIFFALFMGRSAFFCVCSVATFAKLRDAFR